MTAPLSLGSLTLQMAGAAWVSILFEVASIKQKDKQIVGAQLVW